MLPISPKASCFENLLLDSFARKSSKFRLTKLEKNESIYTCGVKSQNLYFIKSGQIKILTLSPNGKECLLAIYSEGDVFGEQCLSKLEVRLDTAIAMEKTVLIVIPRSDFLNHLMSNSFHELFIKYLAKRIKHQQKTITNLTTADCEHRLGSILLHLAKKLGHKHLQKIIIKHKITQAELSEMVGTTRPRISQFMRNFRNRKLIEMSKDNFIIVEVKNLTNYLDQKTFTQ